MGLGKKLAMVAGVLAFGTLFVGPVMGGALIVAFSSGNSCTAVADTTPAGVSQLNGVSAKAYLDQFSQAEQASKLGIAGEIYRVGATRKPAESVRAIVIAIATAIEESDLTNLLNGDANSHGVFQQQPDQGWGTLEQVRNPEFATNAFFNAYHLKVSDPNSMAMIDVAIAVQNPSLDAYRSRWKWDRTAAEIYTQVAIPGATESCATNGWQLPLAKGSYSISDPYGMRFHPIYKVWRLHAGVDLAAAKNTPIVAVHSGVIAFAGANGGLGNYVSINNDKSTLTGYAHMERIAPGITKGAQVTSGQVIGYVGTTGDSTGDHLHFLVNVNGKLVDPVQFMTSVGVSITDNTKG